MMIWIMKRTGITMESLGLLPMFLNADDPRSAREQLDTNYKHGGGWDPFPGFAMLDNGDILYPNDPPTRLLAETVLRDEIIRIYEHSWVAVVQKDGSYEICRMD